MSESFDVRKSDQPFDQSRSLVAVIELSQASRLVADRYSLGLRYFLLNV
jgi:hypothetical protein